MIRAYVFSEANQNWVEQQHLLYHDICAFLDEENKNIYLWSGPKSTSNKLNKGYHTIKTILTSYPPEEFKVIDLTRAKVPEQIQEKIDSMMQIVKMNEQERVQQFTRMNLIRMYYLLSIFGVIVPLVLLFNFIGLSFLSWDANMNVQIPASVYSIWALVSKIIVIAMIVTFSLLLLISALETDIKAGVFALIALSASIGLMLYVAQDIYIYIFQIGSTTDLYLLSLSDLWTSIILVGTALAIIEVFTLYRLQDFHGVYKDFIM